MFSRGSSLTKLNIGSVCARTDYGGRRWVAEANPGRRRRAHECGVAPGQPLRGVGRKTRTERAPRRELEGDVHGGQIPSKDNSLDGEAQSMRGERAGGGP